jgi:Cu/Ag efflux protein CusF
MKLAATVSAVTMLAVISSVALAQQALTGTITKVDRISGVVAIQQTPSGTVGASNGGATEEFKLQGNMLETLHAGDRVTYTVSEANGKKTIAKIDRQ